MSRLLQNTTPAERLLGCSFAENFESASVVEENGGTLYGTPTFSSDGIDLNGVDQYIKYAVKTGETYTEAISIVMEFTPRFGLNPYTVAHTLFDSQSSNRLALRHSGADTFSVYIGGSTIGTPNGSAWVEGERNIIVLSLTGTNNNMWLNGEEVFTSGATPWSIAKVEELFVGANLAFTQHCDMTVHSFRVFKSMLTADDVAFIQSGGKYDPYKDCVINLPMTAETYDPTNSLCLDVSGNGNHFTVLNNARKLHKRGFQLNAPVDALELDSDLISGASEITLNMQINSQWVDGDAIGFFFFYHNTGDFRIYFSGVTNVLVVNIDDGVTDGTQQFNNGHFQLHGHTLLTVVFKEGEMGVYFNGKLQVPDTVSGTLPNTLESATGVPIQISNSANAGDFQVLQSQIWLRALSPLEVAHLYSTQRQEVNRV